MPTFSCVIVDDNELDRLLVEQQVLASPCLKHIGSFANPVECLSLFTSPAIQVLFLDIDMPLLNGIQFMRSIKNPPLCVFITNHSDYASDAFDVQAFDYLLKPVRRERFERTLDRVNEYFAIQEKVKQYDTHLEQDTITFKEGTSIAKVAAGDIVYLEALANYTKVVTPGRNYITLSNLKSFMEVLPQDKFLRIHRSYAVSKKKITGLDSGDVLLGSYKVPFGKTYRKDIHDILLQKRRDAF